MIITRGCIHNVKVGDFLKCIKTNDPFKLNVGQCYEVTNIFNNTKYIELNIITQHWTIETGEIFETEERPNQANPKVCLFKIGEEVRCIDDFGHNFLFLNKIYKISAIKHNAIKVNDSNIWWSLNRWKQVEYKIGSEVKCIKKFEDNKDWFPQLGKTYKITSINNGYEPYILGFKLKAPMNENPAFVSGDIPCWNKNHFELISTSVVIKNKKFKKKLKLDKEKLHEHKCYNCEKQLFPKTMCRCEIMFEPPF